MSAPPASVAPASRLFCSAIPTARARNFLLKPNYITNVQYAGFIQDDWKASARLTSEHRRAL